MKSRFPVYARLDMAAQMQKGTLKTIYRMCIADALFVSVNTILLFPAIVEALLRRTLDARRLWTDRLCCKICTTVTHWAYHIDLEPGKEPPR